MADRTTSIADTPKDGRWYCLQESDTHIHVIKWNDEVEQWQSMVVNADGSRYGDYIPDGTEVSVGGVAGQLGASKTLN